jgi:hypothetical protein
VTKKSDMQPLFNAASGVLESLTDEGYDVIDSGIILCLALVLHKRQHNPKLANTAFLKLIQDNLIGALKDEVRQ